MKYNYKSVSGRRYQRKNTFNSTEARSKPGWSWREFDWLFGVNVFLIGFQNVTWKHVLKYSFASEWLMSFFINKADRDYTFFFRVDSSPGLAFDSDLFRINSGHVNAFRTAPFLIAIREISLRAWLKITRFIKILAGAEIETHKWQFKIYSRLSI